MADRKITAMHRKYGKDCAHKCADCPNLWIRVKNKARYKCAAYGTSGSAATDWNAQWTACGLYGYRIGKGYVPIIKRLKPAKRRKKPMMLMQQIIGTDGVIRTKLDIAIQRLKSFEPPEGYFLAFSGGKDSQAIYHLAKMAGVKFEAHYHVTSVDPPELIYFIREHYPDVIFDIPHDEDGKRISMWSLISQHKMPPTRIVRYCCEELKETNGDGRMVVTGVRWAESARRKANQGVVVIAGKPKTTQKKADELGVDYEVSKSGTLVMNEDNDENRRLAEYCYRTQKMLLNPIVDWTDDEVWEFLNDIVKVPHCRLYDEGFTRLGCIGCPMARAETQKKQFARYPKFREAYVRAFDRMLGKRRAEGLPTEWKDGEDVMRWWLQEKEE